MMDRDGYGHGIDEVIESCCGGYDSADYVRLAMAAAAEAGLETDKLAELRSWLEAPVSHTGILSAEMVNEALAHPCSRYQCLDALTAAPGAGLLRLCLAALDQAGVSQRAQGYVQELLWGEPA